MRILDNQVKPIVPEWPKTLICRHCKSKLEVSQADLKKGDAFYSQREIDHGVKGFDCPCCEQFNAL